MARINQITRVPPSADAMQSAIRSHKSLAHRIPITPMKSIMETETGDLNATTANAFWRLLNSSKAIVEEMSEQEAHQSKQPAAVHRPLTFKTRPAPD